MKRTEASQWQTFGAIAAAIGFVIAGVLVWLFAMQLGNAIDGGKQTVPWNPIAAGVALGTGSVAWTVAMTIATAALTVVAVAAVLVPVIWYQRRWPATRIDWAARHMGRGSGILPLRIAAVRAKAARLKINGSPGLFIAESVWGHTKLWASWEDMWLVIAGPRAGKTTAVAMPAIAAAPGALIATSNKPDLADGSRAMRSSLGTVWVFNPQEVTTDRATWWWNPLSVVTDDVSAEKLARHFANGAREPGARSDAFFDGQGITLLKALLLAAALGDKPITAVAHWLTDSGIREPLQLLDAHGYAGSVIRNGLDDQMRAPEKQRGGVYATAQQMTTCLTNSQVIEWVCPLGPEDTRPQFDHRTFPTSKDTLYSLSKEGAGSAGPLVLALTAAVIEAGEREAAQQPGGRLPVPMVAVLDEAANVCRWKELPDLYSHFGSRGIIILTILQSYPQGVGVWGDEGMSKLWSASNVRIYLGGVASTPGNHGAFLSTLSESIGDREIRTSSSSSGRNGASTSFQRSRDRILDSSELQALPLPNPMTGRNGRAIVMASGARPVLARPIPWWDSPYAEKLKAKPKPPPASKTEHKAVAAHASDSLVAPQLEHIAPLAPMPLEGGDQSWARTEPRLPQSTQELVSVADVWSVPPAASTGSTASVWGRPADTETSRNEQS